MDFVSQEKDLIFLANDEVCQVVKCVEYNEEAYLLVAQIPDRIEDVLENSASRMKLVKEIVEGDKVFVETVDDKELIKKIYEKILNQKSE